MWRSYVILSCIGVVDPNELSEDVAHSESSYGIGTKVVSVQLDSAGSGYANYVLICKQFDDVDRGLEISVRSTMRIVKRNTLSTNTYDRSIAVDPEDRYGLAFYRFQFLIS